MSYQQGPEYPGSYPSQGPDPAAYRIAIVSLALGIIGLLGWIMPPIGIPISIFGLFYGMKSKKIIGHGMATIGIVLSIIGLVLSVISVIYFVYYFFFVFSP